jgi:hypothetical protein
MLLAIPEPTLEKTPTLPKKRPYMTINRDLKTELAKRLKGTSEYKQKEKNG